MVAYMIYYIIAYVTGFSLYIRQALDPPTAWRLLTLGRASSTGHSLPGAHPLDPLVHMFNPSFGMHVSSQFRYTYFILWHSTC